jgi:hypothetical protein
LAGVNLAVPAMAAPVCLDTTRIQDTHVQDPRTIDFRMRDGTVWRNTLRNSCPDLMFHGFSYVIRGGVNEICDNMQTIRVVQSGQVCVLGSFAKLTPNAAHG